MVSPITPAEISRWRGMSAVCWPPQPQIQVVWRPLSFLMTQPLRRNARLTPRRFIGFIITDNLSPLDVDIKPGLTRLEQATRYYLRNRMSLRAI